MKEKNEKNCLCNAISRGAGEEKIIELLRNYSGTDKSELMDFIEFLKEEKYITYYPWAEKIVAHVQEIILEGCINDNEEVVIDRL